MTKINRTAVRALRARLELLDAESADAVARYSAQVAALMLRQIAAAREATLAELHTLIPVTG